MSRRNGKHQHANMLSRSTADQIAMASAVDERYRDLCGTHRRVRHVELVPPVSLMADVMRWREMLLRHRRGDFRNTEAEWQSVKAVAAWTLEENCQLRGQPAIRLECLET